MSSEISSSLKNILIKPLNRNLAARTSRSYSTVIQSKNRPPNRPSPNSRTLSSHVIDSRERFKSNLEEINELNESLVNKSKSSIGVGKEIKIANQHKQIRLEKPPQPQKSYVLSMSNNLKILPNISKESLKPNNVNNDNTNNNESMINTFAPVNQNLKMISINISKNDEKLKRQLLVTQIFRDLITLYRIENKLTQHQSSVFSFN